MASALVIGAGPAGLTAAMKLAEAGIDATVLERDAAPLPGGAEEAWESWERRSVTQFRQVHYLQPRGYHDVREHLPAVADNLRALGAVALNVVELFGAGVPGVSRDPGDERFDTLTTCRRPVLELAFARAAESTPGVRVRRGSTVKELIGGPSAVDGVPHVAGVRLEGGEALHADLVVDAGGRRSPVAALLAALGARPPQESSIEVGFVYNTRYYRGTRPEYLADVLSPVRSISLLTLYGDHDTWGVTIYHAPHDKPMRAVRDPAVFERVVRAHPNHAHWVDGTPLTDVASMASTANTKRDFVVDGVPVATGIVAVGDAWGFTNPSLGRGVALGVMHALDVVPAVVAHLDDPGALATAWHEATAAGAVPYHEATVGFDRARAPEVEAERTGQPLPESDDPVVTIGRMFDSARHYDADVFRAWAEIATCHLLPGEVLGRPGLLDRVIEVAAANERYLAPCPTRAELETTLAA